MINLLPPELSLGKGFSKVSKAIRSLTLVLIVFFIVFGLGLLGFIIFSSIELSSLTASEESLKASIKDRETTEQRLVLLKDRISKIDSARNFDTSSEEISGANELIKFLGANTQITELSFDTKKIELSLIFRKSADLRSFFENVLASNRFGSVILSSFGFNPASGYFVGLKVSVEGIK